MLQRGGREEKRGEGRGRSIPSRPPNPLLTARGLLAGRHERKRERESEGRREESGERERERARVCVCVSPVCARGLHHRIPFTVSAGGHALMERINLTTLSFPSDVPTAVSFQM